MDVPQWSPRELGATEFLVENAKRLQRRYPRLYAVLDAGVREIVEDPVLDGVRSGELEWPQFVHVRGAPWPGAASKVKTRRAEGGLYVDIEFNFDFYDVDSDDDDPELARRLIEEAKDRIRSAMGAAATPGIGDERPGALEPGEEGDADLLVEIHVPLLHTPDFSSGGVISDPFEWIEDVETFLAEVDGGALDYDSGEEWVNANGDREYLFFIHNADEARLLAVAAEVARRPGVPPGAYAVVNSTDGDMGEGRRNDLSAHP